MKSTFTLKRVIIQRRTERNSGTPRLSHFADTSQVPPLPSSPNICLWHYPVTCSYSKPIVLMKTLPLLCLECEKKKKNLSAVKIIFVPTARPKSPDVFPSFRSRFRSRFRLFATNGISRRVILRISSCAVICSIFSRSKIGRDFRHEKTYESSPPAFLQTLTDRNGYHRLISISAHGILCKISDTVYRFYIGGGGIYIRLALTY